MPTTPTTKILYQTARYGKIRIFLACGHVITLRHTARREGTWAARTRHPCPMCDHVQSIPASFTSTSHLASASGVKPENPALVVLSSPRYAVKPFVPKYIDPDSPRAAASQRKLQAQMDDPYSGLLPSPETFSKTKRHGPSAHAHTSATSASPITSAASHKE